MKAYPRLGVSGAGYWGSNLVRVCAELGVLDCVCDTDPDRLGAVQAHYPNVHVETDLDAFLARNIDGVLIAAPAMLHADLAIEAIAAGKHVFVEKPLALNTSDAARVVRAARAGGRVLFVGHLLFYHPAVQRLLALINEGAIGEVRHARSRRLSWGKLRTEENVWWSFAPHDVALALHIFDEEPKMLQGALAAFVRPDIADFAYADFIFSKGRTAHIEVGWLDPDKGARLDVFGSKGVLCLTDIRGEAKLTLTPCADVHDASGAHLERGEATQVAFPNTEPLRAEIEAFIEAIRTGVPPLTDGEEGLRVVNALSKLAVRDARAGIVEVSA